MRPSEKHLSWILMGLIALIAAFFTWELIGRFLYEASGAFNGDSPVYWAVGRGLVNGLRLYTDILEIKPPGIFVVSALSYFFTGTMTLGHILQGLVFVVLPFTVLVPVFFCTRTAPKTHRLFGLLIGLAFAAGITMYTALGGGEFQTESFGVLLPCAYVGIAMLLRERKSILWTILAGICVFGGIVFKEPFGLSVVAAGLLLCRKKEDVLHIVILPVLIGGILFLLTLLWFGALDPYLNVYLPFMTGVRTTRFGSPFSRAVLLEAVWTNLWQFSPFFALALGLLWLWSLVRASHISVRSFSDVLLFMGFLAGLVMVFYGAQTDRVFQWQTGLWHVQQSPFWLGAGTLTLLTLWYRLLLPSYERKWMTVHMAALLFALFSVGYLSGLSGEFLGHHLLFALPIYFSLMFLCIETLMRSDHPFSLFSIVLAALLVVAVFVHQKTDYADSRSHWAAEAAHDQMLADKIDAVLDSCNVKQYLIAGGPGTNVFGYTRHSPIGPIFFQNTFINIDSAFTKAFATELMEASILVAPQTWGLETLPGTLNYIMNDFTDIPGSCAGPSFTQPEGNIVILFRTKKTVPRLIHVDEGKYRLDF